MRRVFLLLSTAALVAACGPAAVPARAQVPGLDRLSGEVAAIDVDLPGVDLSSVRGPSGWVVVGATFDSGRVVGGSAPECALRRTLSGSVPREPAPRQLRPLAAARPDEAEAVATFLGAAAASAPGYLAASEVGGDPTGQLDLSRPLPAGSSQSAVLAGALWAWGDALGDPAYAAKAALSAARAVTQRSERGGPAALLSLVAGPLDGAQRDQACAVV